MGEITIKVPQRIRKTFDISNKVVVDKMLKELETNTVKVSKKRRIGKKDLAELSAFMKEYRSRMDLDTQSAISTAEEWRKRWDR
jgi:hypothetical protein